MSPELLYHHESAGLVVVRLCSSALSCCHSPDEQARIAKVLNNPGRVDAATIEHFETILWRCKRLDDAFGARGVLETVLIQRQLLHTLREDCPADLWPRLLSALSISSRLAGWCSFDLTNFDSAAYYYEDVRVLAHEAENMELSAMTLCQMSGLTLRRAHHVGHRPCGGRRAVGQPHR
ncbi:MAG: hypothetical protein ACRDTG_09340 [Pseudonocardiaceae bacterium]